MGRRTKSALWVLGALVSAALASTAFFHWNVQGGHVWATPRFAFDDFFAELGSHVRWLGVFCALSAAVLPLRAYQWQRTLAHRVAFRERYHLVAIGAFTHNALPGKLGDLLRAFLMSRTQRLSFLQVLGSVVVGKLLELCALLTLLALLLFGPAADAAARFRGPLQIAAPICVALVVFVLVVAHHAQAIATRLARYRYLHTLSGWLREIGEGLGAARSTRGMLIALAVSFAPVLASSLGYGFALHSMGIAGGLLAGPLILGAITIGQTAVMVPAGMGIYYFLTSWTARKLGASPEDAAAYAALTHAATVATQVMLGSFSIWARRIRIADLRRGGALAAVAAHELTEKPADAEAASQAW